MFRFILKRIALSIPMLLGIAFITFLFIQLAPGNFLDSLQLNPNISDEIKDYYKETFHLDKPVIIQYLYWLRNIVHLDFGYSFTYKVPVINVIVSRSLNTLILSVSSILFIWLVMVPLGVIAAVYQRKLIDNIISFISYMGISTPTFFLAFLLLFLAMVTGWLPLGGMHSILNHRLSGSAQILDVAKHLIIPVLALSMGSIFALQRIMRASMIEVLQSSYIISAKARGISRVRILYIHALKNAINPLITIFGYQISGLLSGAALIEIICGWPGLGTVILKAVQAQDIYLVMGVVMISGMMLILGNLIADILLAYFDPRIRYERNV